MNLDLRCFHKEDTPPDIYRSRFHEICSQYDGFHRLYTDGSKVGDQVASAAVTRNFTKAVRLANKASIFRANYTQLLLPWISWSVSIVSTCYIGPFHISSHLDGYNAILPELSKFTTDHLQHLLNTTSQVIIWTHKFNHNLTDLLHSKLHHVFIDVCS